jgi:UDP-N-acetylglucosamine 2-epimerase
VRRRCLRLPAGLADGRRNKRRVWPPVGAPRNNLSTYKGVLMPKRKLLHIVGNRPQFIKLATLLRALPAREFLSVIVHSGQHYDYEMSEVFFRELGMPKPNYFLDARSGTHGVQTARVLARLDPVWGKEKPDVAVVYGDTNTTLAGALSAYKFRLPLAHVESGLREFVWRPEEINKRMADHCSDFCFCPTRAAVENLEREGLAKERIFLTGDITYDSFLWSAERVHRHASVTVPKEDFFLLTLHRAETVDCKEYLATIVGCLLDCRKTICFPVHPRTQLRLRRFGLWGKLQKASNVHVLPALGYFDFLAFLLGCAAVLTDSGGVIRESYYARKPCVVLDHSTEYFELVAAGATLVAGHDGKSIKRAIDCLSSLHITNRQRFFGDGNAGERMAEILQCSPRKKEF